MKCPRCDRPIAHLHLHTFGKCKRCGTPVDFCEECLQTVKPRGDSFKDTLNRIMFKLQIRALER